MPKFELTRVPAVVKRTQSFSAKTMPWGPSALPTKVVEVEMLMEINASEALKTLDALFPNADVISKMIAGDDEMPGQDITARGKLGAMTMALHYGTEEAPVVDVSLVQIKSRPQLKIDEKGNAKLVLKPRGLLTAKQNTDTWEMLGADGFITLRAAQLDIDDMTRVADKTDTSDEETGKKGKKGKKGKGAAAADKKAGTKDPFEDPAESGVH